MSGMPSLESSIRTCKVDTAWDVRAQSDRFLNPMAMSCPTWGGTDLTGRKVCPDSFMTKSAGCNSAEDRVVVENNVSRPQYMEYITLNASGIAMNNPSYSNTFPQRNLTASENNLRNTIQGNQGKPGGPNWPDVAGTTLSGCNMAPYAQSQAMLAQGSREATAAACYSQASRNRSACNM